MCAVSLFLPEPCVNGFEELLAGALIVTDIDLALGSCSATMRPAMKLLLYLVIFDGYTIGGRSEPGSARNRKSD